MHSESRTPNLIRQKNEDYYLTWNALRISDPRLLSKKKPWLYHLTWKVFRISDPSTLSEKKK